MATTHSMPSPGADLVRGPEVANATGNADEEALIPSPHMPEDQASVTLNSHVARLPVELDVAIPVRDFRVRKLLALEPGQVIETQWGHGDDLPLSAGDVQLAWSEFEVVETALAVRLTRLA